MIKLIASDMDGTLLNNKKELPPDLGGVIEQLFERNVKFAVASGRTYSAVGYLFPEEYRDKLCYICDNGACTVINGRTMNVTGIERPLYERLLEACLTVGGLTPVVCTEKGVYHQRGDEEFFNEVGIYYRDHIVIDDLRNVEGIVYKLAVCDEDGEALTRGKVELDKRFEGQLNVMVSGVKWMDVMKAGVNKGMALRALQKTLGVTKEETMAFGDYFNDVDMLMAADHSFAMENGHEEVKKLCRFTAPDNEHFGVTESIKRYVLNKENE